ncbi:ribonuclease Z [Rhodobacteraceae bacterium THAF1]|uniref:MBL fold metallo-hydrolase n=1 Tax=Palleronia sp. THAF1 TaxID=2587842 RepID=UPI000F3D5D6D|nr:MBL fold metallo-hydrolase [Palleronia sp. THAF1]QFU09444.1 Ribonuclease BN [Palleronia sp. THAF1]VDC21898.1 ribonuclease Z [Rhodobacteraceae bacterium THAF1]
MDSITLMGCKGGPAIRPGSQMPTSTLVRLAGQVVLVDAGLGAARGLCDANVSLTALDAIIITHLHSDHYLELGPLLHTAWTAGLKRPVPIYGPTGLADYWQHFCAAMAFDIDLRIADEGRPDLRDLVTIHEITPSFTIGSLFVTTIRNDHPPIADSFAVRLEGGGKTVVISGDTAPLPAMTDFARDADLLVHEAMLTAGVDALFAATPNGDDRLRTHILRSHTSAEEAGRIATKAGAKHLALNHLVPDGLPGFGPQQWEAPVRQTYDGPLTIGRDGVTIPL